MEENDNQSNKIVEAGKNVAKGAVKKLGKKAINKVVMKILPYIGYFFFILLALGCVLAVSQFIVDIFASVLGVFSSNDDPISVVAERYDNTILGAAAQIYEEEVGWKYWENLDEISHRVSKQLANPNKATCCATYVSCVLYASGYATEEEIGYDYHQPKTVRNLIISKGWQQIEGVENRQPGDILFYYRDGAWIHTDICAGVSDPGGYMLWYDGGKIADVTSSLPVVNQKNWDSYDIVEIYRPPAEAPYDPAERPNQDYKGELLSIRQEKGLYKGLYKYNCKDLAEKVIEELEDSNVDTEHFDFKGLENNLQKYIDIEIATSYPKIRNILNTLLLEVDGNIVIKRASTDLGKIENLEYVEYEEFCKNVSAGSTDMIHKFSINPHTLALCIAKEGTTTSFEDFSGNVTESSEPMTIHEENFRKLIEDQITPFNFLLSLHLISQNDEFMQDVLDLIKENDEPITLTYVDTQYERNVMTDYSGSIALKYTSSDSAVSSNTLANLAGSPGNINNTNISQYSEYVGDLGYKKVTTIMRRGKFYVSNAETWLTTGSKKISEQSKTLGGDVSTGEKINVVSTATTTTETKEIGDEEYELTKTKIINIDKTISTSSLTKKFTVTGRSKRINVDDFVKLIKKYPDVEDNFTSSPSFLFDLLNKDTKTQRLEKIMRFVMYKLTDKYYGVLEADLYDKYTSNANRITYSILDMAPKIHDEEMDWTYSTDKNELMVPISKQLENPNKVTNGAAYVSCVLYKAEFLSDYDIFSVMGDFLDVEKLDQQLSKMEWEKIEDRNDFVAGDIVFLGNDDKKAIDVVIYAGRDAEGYPLWYSASSTEDIQGSAPKKTEKDWPTGIVWAYRAPKNGTFERVSGEPYIGGYYTSLDGRVFTIFDQGQCDARWDQITGNDESRCNRVATCIVASGYPNISEGVPINESPSEIVENMGAKYDGIISGRFLKEYGLEVDTNKYPSWISVSKYPDIIREQIVDKKGYVLIWLDGRNMSGGYVGKSGRTYTKLYHWLAILDYKETEDGEEQILVADSCNATWYDIDEFSSGITTIERINVIENEENNMKGD